MKKGGKDSYAIGVDIGGTKIAAGLVSKDGKLLKKKTIATEAERGKDVVVYNIIRTIREVINDSACGIGVGCPGPLDPETETILNTPNLPLKGVKLRQVLEQEFGLPTRVDNDANCFVLGESIFGKAKKKSVVAGLTLGTGVGGGIVLNKEVLHGSGNAGELGHMTIKYDGPKSTHGNFGEIEEYLSARGLMKLAKKEGIYAHDPIELQFMASSGKKKVKNIFHEYGSLLGIAIVNIIDALDPQAIVIGGNLTKAHELFEKNMFEEMKKRQDFNNAVIHFTSDTERHAILGAASLVLPRENMKKDIKKTKKPWGGFNQYSLNKKSTVKILTLTKGQSLSLQSHNNRDEMWVALDDGLTIELNGKKTVLKEGQEVLIPRLAQHRLTAKKRSRVLEVSFGDFDEKDITRYEDKYGRAGKTKTSKPKKSTSKRQPLIKNPLRRKLEFL